MIITYTHKKDRKNMTPGHTLASIFARIFRLSLALISQPGPGSMFHFSPLLLCHSFFREPPNPSIMQTSQWTYLQGLFIGGIALGLLWDCCWLEINWDCCYEVNSPIVIALPSPGTALGLLGIVTNNPMLGLQWDCLGSHCVPKLGSHGIAARNPEQSQSNP